MLAADCTSFYSFQATVYCVVGILAVLVSENVTPASSNIMHESSACCIKIDKSIHISSGVIHVEDVSIRIESYKMHIGRASVPIGVVFKNLCH
jgi:hypothetical protein